ncbi:MAG: N-formylglutamate amidohydrolase [Paracoccaceae bacterium]|nr:N-formylglutamate amidohydrolase [Paracoccaceae bacterium]
MKNLSHDHIAYEIRDPEVLLSPVVFSSPHSGRDYSKAFLKSSVLDSREIRSSEDAYVDKLIDFIIEIGAPLLLAKAPRAYVDMNRSSDELDPDLIEGVRNRGQNPRVNSGLGVIPRVVSNSRSIYRGKLTRAEADLRINNYWRPYHLALSQLLARAEQQFGYSLLVDMHSMPHEAIAYLGRLQRCAQIVLGDRFGTSADLALVEIVETALAESGLCVSRNVPFAGAYITQNYGRPGQSRHVVQIEIDRSLYLDEGSVELSEDFHDFRKQIGTALSKIVQYTRNEAALAAE